MSEEQLLTQWRDASTSLWLVSTSPPNAPAGHLSAKVVSFDLDDAIVLEVEYAQPLEFRIPAKGATFLPDEHPQTGHRQLIIVLSGRADALIELQPPLALPAA